jgi:hypothetical protein
MNLRCLQVLILITGLACLGPLPGWAQERQEIRPTSRMSGTIVAPLDQGKQALSGGDKVLISLREDLPLKPGDFLEVFQPVDPTDKDAKDPLLKKIGLAVLLEKVKEKLYLCVIDASTREVSIGNQVLIVETR